MTLQRLVDPERIAPAGRTVSGTQYEISAGGYIAQIASIGASLRSLRFGKRDLVVPFEANEVRPAFRGAILAPWPNRVVDGIYTFAGKSQALEITEQERGHALHGLVAWLDFRCVGLSATGLTLVAELAGEKGYPHELEITAEYRVDERGLHTTVSAKNIGDTDAPYGASAHPYLRAGEGRVDDWFLELPAERVLTVTSRLAPLTEVAVEDLDLDFRHRRSLSGELIDHAFTGFPSETRVARVTVADGTGVAIIWDQACPWVQVHTADLPEHELSRRGLAVEPMTCAPNAFNSGKDLITLHPGEDSHARWLISALG